MSVSVGAYMHLYGMFTITEPTGDASVPKEDGDRNSSKMSIILVEGVCLVFPPFCYILFYSV
jgi:hypothetical protein